MSKSRNESFPFSIVLASNSPRRREILRTAGLRVRAVPGKVREAPPSAHETPARYAVRLARLKARSIASRVSRSSVILAADTIVCLGRKILGKPRSFREAQRMLRQLSGRTHRVVTGVVLIDLRTHHTVAWAESTKVTFATLTPEEIEAYVRSREPFDKAGAYAVQGRAGKFVTRIEGCFFNVVGLPIGRVYRELKRLSQKQSIPSTSTKKKR